MLVIGCDVHKRTHTCAAVCAGLGELKGSRTARAVGEGFAQLLLWARELDCERVWVLEDCRGVSGGFESFLLGHGERVLRAAPHWTARERRVVRTRGKSDEIDALAVARIALREGIDSLPEARVDERALEIKLLADHRDDLVRRRTQDHNRLREAIHLLWPEIDLPTGCFLYEKHIKHVSGKLGRAKQTTRVRIAKRVLSQIKDANRAIAQLDTEIETLVNQYTPQLVSEIGCGFLTAARLVGEIAGIDRFRTEAQLARMAGTAPVPISSGKTQRLRLDRGGNRLLNAAIYRIAITKARIHPETQKYIARLINRGKTKREALRCLKRQLIRRIWKLLNQNKNPQIPNTTTT